MGGGPASADVVRASCLLTFPEESMVEPVPVDAWYLHAVGLTFLRRLARDRVGDAPRIALLLQKHDDDASPPRKRYISVENDTILRDALQETFVRPERVLVLHIIALDKVLGQKSIHVTPEINPNVSPEPVAPLAMVFPTLAVETAEPVPEAMALSSSFRLSRSVYDLEKPSSTKEPLLAHSDSWLNHHTQTFGFAGTSKHVDTTPLAPLATAATAEAHDAETPFALAAAGAQLVGDRQHEHDYRVEKLSAKDDSAIPMARVVGHVAERIPSDYVMLELQNGAGLGAPPSATPATSSSFFISPTWHLHADELSASARLRAAEAAETSAVARPIAEWSALPASTSSDSNSSSSGMEDSFVMLESTTTTMASDLTRRRIL